MKYVVRFICMLVQLVLMIKQESFYAISMSGGGGDALFETQVILAVASISVLIIFFITYAGYEDDPFDLKSPVKILMLLLTLGVLLPGGD